MKIPAKESNPTHEVTHGSSVAQKVSGGKLRVQFKLILIRVRLEIKLLSVRFSGGRRLYSMINNGIGYHSRLNTVIHFHHPDLHGIPDRLRPYRESDS